MITVNPADLAADFFLVDGLEIIHYHRLDESGASTVVVQIGTEEQKAALPRSATNEVIVDPVLISAAEVLVWHFPASMLDGAGIRPQRGDIIVDVRGIRWVVWKTQTQTFRTRYRLTCVRE